MIPDAERLAMRAQIEALADTTFSWDALLPLIRKALAGEPLTPDEMQAAVRWVFLSVVYQCADAPEDGAETPPVEGNNPRCHGRGQCRTHHE